MITENEKRITDYKNFFDDECNAIVIMMQYTFYVLISHFFLTKTLFRRGVDTSQQGSKYKVNVPCQGIAMSNTY